MIRLLLSLSSRTYSSSVTYKNGAAVTAAAKMVKYLNVAEKNDAAKSIAGLLSRGSSNRREGYSQYNKIYEFDYTLHGQNVQMIMTSVSGHLLTHEFLSSFRGWQSCSPEQLFDAPVRKQCPENYEKIKKTLEREVRGCQALIIWTDCDREGENIGFEIIEVCRAVKPQLKVFRAKFSEITTASIKRAIENLIAPDERQSNAVDVRSELDLRIGAAFTRYQTLRLQRIFPDHIVNKLVSYGSCQIPTLGFVAQRYKEVENFIPQTFWKLKLNHTIGELTVEFNWARNRLFDKQCCEAYLQLCQLNPTAKVVNVVNKPKSKWRPTPMDTVELEKLGSRKLKMTAKQVMTIAEKLYTQGIISYPRTETNMFTNDMKLEPLVEQQTAQQQWGTFARKVLQWGPNPRNGKKSDQAHPPIHPTKLPTNLAGDEWRVYELIARHFLACVSRDATGSETIVNVVVADEEEFTATGLCIHERNYLEVYPYDRWNAKEIHAYQLGNVFEPTELSLHEGSTTAPNMLTEADLIALMEKHGIGTDATHAEHINTIKERGYIGERDRGFLVPGTLGMGLVEGYELMELRLAHPELRAGLEADLKLICQGRKDPAEVLQQQIEKYKEVYRIMSQKSRSLDQALGQRLNQTPRDAPEEQTRPMTIMKEVCKCPKCDQMMMLRAKKDNNGFYIGCLGFPDCKNSVWFDDDVKEAIGTDEPCPRCGSKKIQLKFRHIRYYGLLQSESCDSYKTCVVCDAKLRELLNIANGAVLQTNRNGIRADINIPSRGTAPSASTSAPSIGTGNRSNNPLPPPSGWGNGSSEANPRGWGSGSSEGNSRGWGGNTRPWDDDRRGGGGGAISTGSRTTAAVNSGSTTWGSQSSSRRNDFNDGNTSSTWGRSDDGNRPSSTWGRSDDGNRPATGGWSGNNSNWNTGNSNDNRRTSAGEEQIMCRCGTPANKFTVKKDGPNKGRPFYSCPNQASKCNFFKWGDENVAPNATGNTGGSGSGNAWGSNSAGPSSSRSTGTANGWNSKSTATTTTVGNKEKTTRKCGYCRQEGHTKNRCPQREGDDF